MLLEQLPDHLIRAVFISVAETSRQGDLCRDSRLAAPLCLVNHQLLLYGRETLYHSIHFSDAYTDTEEPPRDRRLLRTLAFNRDLFGLVRNLNITVVCGKSNEALELLKATYGVQQLSFYAYGPFPNNIAEAISKMTLTKLHFGQIFENGISDLSAIEREAQRRNVALILNSQAATCQNLSFWSHTWAPDKPAPAFKRLIRFKLQCDHTARMENLVFVQQFLLTPTTPALTRLQIICISDYHTVAAALLHVGPQLLHLTLEGPTNCDPHLTRLFRQLAGHLRACKCLQTFDISAEWFGNDHLDSLPDTLQDVILDNPAQLEPQHLVKRLSDFKRFPNLVRLRANWRPYAGTSKRALRESRNQAIEVCDKRGIQIVWPETFFRAWDWSESEYSEGSSSDEEAVRAALPRINRHGDVVPRRQRGVTLRGRGRGR